MTYRRISYDAVKWHANEAKRRPRRASTRWLLLLGLAFALAAPVSCVLDGPDTQGLVSFGFYMPLFFAFAFSPFARDTLLFDRGLATFDEFERDAITRATRLSYATLLCLVLAAIGWLWFAGPRGLPVPTSSQDWSACAFTLLVAGMALPVAFAEWTVPLPPPFDEMEE